MIFQPIFDIVELKEIAGTTLPAPVDGFKWGLIRVIGETEHACRTYVWARVKL